MPTDPPNPQHLKAERTVIAIRRSTLADVLAGIQGMLDELAKRENEIQSLLEFLGET